MLVAATVALIGALIAIAILGRRRDLAQMDPPKSGTRFSSNGNGNGNGNGNSSGHGNGSKPRHRLPGTGIDVRPKSKARHR